MKRDEQIRMLLHPEKYSDEQMDQMLEEANIPVPDAETAWKRFSVSKLYTQNSKLRRIAAMFIGVLMLSGIAYAAVHLIRNHEAGNCCGNQHPTPITKHPNTSRQYVVEARYLRR